MSFADALPTESGESYELDMQDRSDAGHEEVASLSSFVFQLTTHVSSFKRLVDTLGSPKDSRQLRSRLNKSRESIQEMAKETSQRLKVLNEKSKDGLLSNTVKTSQSKIVRDFHTVLKEFQKAQKICIEREGIYTPQEDSVPVRTEASGGALEASTDREPLLAAHTTEKQKVEMVTGTMDGEISINRQLIDDRESGIEQIQQQIQEVNEIFQDLAVLVTDQGQIIDDIETNINKTSTRTKEGHEELVKADASQRTARNRMCYLAIFFMIVLIVLMIVLLGS